VLRRFPLGLCGTFRRHPSYDQFRIMMFPTDGTLPGRYSKPKSFHESILKLYEQTSKESWTTSIISKLLPRTRREQDLRCRHKKSNRG